MLSLCSSFHFILIILSLAIVWPIQPARNLGRDYIQTSRLPSWLSPFQDSPSFCGDCVCPELCPLVLKAREMAGRLPRVLGPGMWYSLRLTGGKMQFSVPSIKSLLESACLCSFSSPFRMLLPGLVQFIVVYRWAGRPLSCTGSRTPGSGLEITVVQCSFCTNLRPGQGEACITERHTFTLFLYLVIYGEFALLWKYKPELASVGKVMWYLHWPQTQLR